MSYSAYTEMKNSIAGNRVHLLQALFALLLVFVPASGHALELSGSVIAGGGGRSTDGATLSMDGTIGQPIAGTHLSSARFSMDLGFWTVPAERLLNISTRLRVLTGDNALIGGFIITGSDPKRVILRAIGPSLGGSGVQGVLQDPTLELHDNTGTAIASNNNWQESQAAEIVATTVPPTNDLESAIVTTLPANNASYTIVVRGNGDTTGVGLVEAYDLDQAANSKLANISTRGFVDTDNNVMIGGFIVGGADGGSSQVVVRAIGPSLAGSGVSGALQDPVLELHNGSGALVAMNDNWKDTQQAALQATGIPPTNDAESAIVEMLPPGAYTAIVEGKNGTTGIAVVEVYILN